MKMSHPQNVLCSGFRMMKIIGEQLDTKQDVGSIMFFPSDVHIFRHSKIKWLEK